jgi:TP901 family phage tail tape measure protein
VAGGTLVVRFVGDVREFQRSVAGIQRSLVGLVGAGVAVGDALRGALNLDREFTRIDALTNATDANIARFREQVKALSGTTARAPEELAQAMFFLASSGLDAKQAMQALDASAKAAAVGLGRTEDIARVVSQALNAYAQSGLTAERATDVLLAAVREGSAEPSQFAEALGRILPIANQAGVGFDEVTASLAALSNIGLDVNEGVTAMRGLLQSLAAPTDQTTQALEALGLTTDQLRAIIAERGVLAALRLLEERSGGNLDVMRELIPNVRALTGAFGLTGQEAAKVNAIFSGVKNSTGALGEAFQETTESDSFRFNQAVNDIRKSLVELGTVAVPVVADALRVVADNMEAVVATVATWKLGQMAVELGVMTGALKRLGLTAAALRVPLLGAAAALNGLIVAGSSALMRQSMEALDGTERELLRRLPAFGRGANPLGLDALRQDIQRTAQVTSTATGNMGRDWTATVRTVGSAVRAVQGRVTGFADMTSKTLLEWRDGVSKSFREAVTSLSGFERGWGMTSQGLTRTIREMAAKAKTLAADIRVLDREGVPDRFKAWLLEQGPAAVDRFARATESQQERMVRSWRDLDAASQMIAKRIERLTDPLSSPFHRARDAVGRLRDAILGLDGIRATATVDVVGVPRGQVGVPKLAHGGIVRRPTLALVGEQGPEAVVPLSRMREVRETREVAPRRIDISLIVDRRRFVDQQQVAYAWER